MFERILVAVDGSKPARRAVAHALELARLVPGAHVRVLHVMGAPEPDGRYDALHYGSLIGRQQEHGQELIAATCAEFTAARVTNDAVLLRGAPAKTLVEQAEAWQADLIVMGSRGLSDWKGLLLGSTSHQVMQLARCPVLVVK